MRREFQIEQKRPKRWPLAGVLLVAVLYLVLFNHLSKDTNELYDTAVQAQAAAAKDYTQSVRIGPGSEPLVVLADQPFRTGTRWIYVSKWHHIPDSYIPPNLVTITVPHAASNQPFQLTETAAKALETMFKDAQTAGVPLVVSSAYRSTDDQTDLRHETIATRGQVYADNYIAAPGTSEHQTGLAVDINTYSESCTTNANTCAISPETAEWLEKNAPRYGFILRYPKNTSDLTGISNEPWHFRYIGPEATTITASGLVYDQIVRRIDPELFK